MSLAAQFRQAWQQARAFIEGHELFAPYLNHATHPWKVDRGPLEYFEQVKNTVAVDLINWRRHQGRESSDKWCQHWELVLPIAALGTHYDRQAAEDQAMDIMSVLVTMWTGDGSRLGVAQSTYGIQSSWLDNGQWQIVERKDQFVSIAQIILTIHVFINMHD